MHQSVPSPARLVLPGGGIFELHGNCSLGRGLDNTVRLANDHASRNHAILQAQGNGEFWLVDLGSSNGTSVNGRRISRPQALKDGDRLDLAGSGMLFHAAIQPPDAGIDEDSLGSTLLRVVKRSCWLMVADIAGSTRMAQALPPEQVPRITGGWFKTCREVIEKHDGHMNQYLGDGFFCYWEDGAGANGRVLAALRDLADLQSTASPAFRVVVHRGMTVLGSVPTLTAQNLHGPAVNFVFRMEKLAGSWGDERLCSEDAWQALGVKSLVKRESEVGGYDGLYRFHVPDLG